MNSTPNTDSTRILRIAAWVWLGFLIAMAIMDFALYTPWIQRLLIQDPRIQPLFPNQPVILNPNPQVQNLPRVNLFPIYLYYAANSFAVLFFLFLSHWDDIKNKLGRSFYPFMLFIVSISPILINTLIVPRFPQGPLSNAEGMALRQIPVLFVALALVAWEYRLGYVVVFSVAVTALELWLITFHTVEYRNFVVFLFIGIIRTISFIAVGIFISTLVKRLRQGQESLREANANLTHYASTLEQLTLSRERNRLARELHDTLAHSLTALSVSLEAAKAYFDIDRQKTRELIDTSLESTRKGVDETRRALKALRSSDLEDLGLGLSLQRMAQSAASRFKLDLELALPDSIPSLSPDVEQTIHRIAQEAIQNITNHSGARKFSLRLDRNHNTTLAIEDNGIGFDPSKAPTGHFGLVGMRERAELAGGTLTVESARGKGTKVVLKI